MANNQVNQKQPTNKGQNNNNSNQGKSQMQGNKNRMDERTSGSAGRSTTQKGGKTSAR